MNTSQPLLAYGKVTSQSVIPVILERRYLVFSDTANISMSSAICDMARMALKSKHIEHMGQCIISNNNMHVSAVC